MESEVRDRKSLRWGRDLTRRGSRETGRRSLPPTPRWTDGETEALGEGAARPVRERGRGGTQAQPRDSGLVTLCSPLFSPIF